jgi:ketosteroid isomerase-like protein
LHPPEQLGAEKENEMTSSADIVREAYRRAEGDVLDADGFRDLFTEDGVFNNKAMGETATGDELGGVVRWMGGRFSDVHRELLDVQEIGDVVAVQLVIEGTFDGAFPTPYGDIPPSGTRISVPTADFWYLRDGKITQFDCYMLVNILLAQIGVYPDFSQVIPQPAS